MMRAFVATPFPTPPPLRAVLDELRACGADLKVVSGEQMHLTYKFLGEIEEPQAPQILGALDELRSFGAFDVPVRDVGAFPDWHRLNVLWAGLDDPEKRLGAVAARVEKAVVGLGFPPEERAFRAHLTIARKRSSGSVEKAKDILTAARGRAFGTFHVGDVHLVRSTLTPDGPVYDSVGRVEL